MASIGVDFDGVIHTYDKGWQGGEIYGDIIPGAKDALRGLLDRYTVFVFSTRTDTKAMANFITEKTGIPTEPDDGSFVGPFWNTSGTILVTNRKLAAVAYIDDRAIRFVDWQQTLKCLAEQEKS